MKIKKNCSTLHKLQITILVFIIHIEAHRQIVKLLRYTDTVFGCNNYHFHVGKILVVQNIVVR